MKKRSIITRLAHELIKLYVTKDDVVIDATMGHGFDTLFLAGIAKKVYAFDIQESALLSTKEKINPQQQNHIQLIHDSHEHILNYVQSFKGVIFNLGYLPHGDKTITTNKHTTLTTIDSILPYIPYQGFISIVVYPGHEAGYEESLALNDYLKTIDTNTYHILRVDLPYQNNKPPYILMIIKEKEDVHTM